MSCKCQLCEKQYRVDLIIPDNVWEKIKPDGKANGAALLCGACIMNKIESFGEYGVIRIDGGSNVFNISI
ncbi:hypothetical protein KAR91_15525 [Candidatus Pacearchaeota archaeon]|nr:hypothetical protein [Candidatus Pacearchaeota archaeon]